MGLLWLLAMAACAAAAVPPEGAIFREYRVAMRGDEWRVTDPKAGHPGAAKFLPNPAIRFPIEDLTDAVRAEILVDRWGGHPGTTGQRVRFNGNAWIDLPSLSTTPPSSSPECFMWQDNPAVAIPLSHLRTGENTLEATAGDQICHGFRWGQWGQNAAIVRVYYADRKLHARGWIQSPSNGALLEENPILRLAAEAPEEVERVDFLAWYDGYDENGDGVFADWHHAYFYDRRVAATAEDPRISGHAGTALASPWEVVWDTRWIPDQPPGGLKIAARIRARSGIWYVTPPVIGLRLARGTESVRFFRPEGVPERFWVRAGRRAASQVTVPSDPGLAGAVEAAIFVRTWNGAGEQLTVNGWAVPISGGDHVYALSRILIPIERLRAGANTIEFHSVTEHHGVEILWPGPGLVIRYRR